MGWGVSVFLNFMLKFLVAIVFGYEIHIFIPKLGQDSNFYS